MLEQVKTRPSPLGDAIRVENDRVTIVREAELASPKMDALVRQAVFGAGEERDYARWLIWEIGEAVGVRAGIDQRALHGPRQASRAWLHGACDQRPRRCLRHGAVDLPNGHQAECRRVPARDRAIGNRIHGSTARGVRGCDAGRCLTRGFPRPGLHSGRSLPGQRQEVRRRP